MDMCQKHLTRYVKQEIVFFTINNHYHETWVGDFKLELKCQREVWKGENSQRLQKFQHQAAKVKQMMVVADDYTGVIATYTVPYCHTVD